MGELYLICATFIIVCLQTTLAPRPFVPCSEHENILDSSVFPLPDIDFEAFSVGHIYADGIMDNNTPCSLFYYHVNLCSKVKITILSGPRDASSPNIIQPNRFTWAVQNSYKFLSDSDYTGYFVDFVQHGDGSKLIYSLTFRDPFEKNGPMSAAVEADMNSAHRKRKDSGIYVAVVYADEAKRNYVFRTCRRDIRRFGLSQDDYFSSGGFAVHPWHTSRLHSSVQQEAYNAYDIFFTSSPVANDNTVQSWYKIPR